MRRNLTLILCIILLLGYLLTPADALIRPKEPLHRAAQAGDLRTVTNLVAQGADVNALDAMIGDAPLHWAAAAGHLDVVKFLVESGADVNLKSRDGQPVIFAAVYESADIARYLVEHGANIHVRDRHKETLAHAAVTFRKWENAEYFISRGIDLNARNDKGRTALHLFAWYGEDPGLIDAFVAHGADVNLPTYHGVTPLHDAVRHKRTGIVQALIRAGADVNLEDENGLTPLFLAMGAPLPIVQALVEAGAEINIQNKYGWSVFHRIPLKGSLEYSGNACEIIEYLVRKGGNINLRDKHGRTPIYDPARDGDLDVVTCLVENGADLNVKDQTGRTPLSWAMLYRQFDVAKFLRRQLP